MAKVQFAVTTDGDKLSAMTKDIKARSTLLRSDIHVASCSVIAHAVKHGDATLATHYPTIVTEAMGEGWRLNALRSWFQDLGCFVWVAKEGDKPAGFKIDKDKRKAMKAEMDKDEDAYLAKLIKLKTFWEYKPEPEFQVYSWRAVLAKAIKDAQRKQKDEARKAKGSDDFAGLDEAIELLEAIETAKSRATKAKAEGKKPIKAKAA